MQMIQRQQSQQSGTPPQQTEYATQVVAAGVNVAGATVIANQPQGLNTQQIGVNAANQQVFNAGVRPNIRPLTAQSMVAVRPSANGIVYPVTQQQQLQQQLPQQQQQLQQQQQQQQNPQQQQTPPQQVRQLTPQQQQMLQMHIQSKPMF